MKKAIFSLAQTVLQMTLLLALCVYSLGAVSIKPVYASASDSSCGQMLADAKAQFMATLSPDGSVPVSPETKAAALQYIRVSKLCYDEIAAQDATSASQSEVTTVIDQGGLTPGSASSAEYALTGTKWGYSTQGTSGGTVTYSFMGNGISFASESTSYGNSVALTSLPGFQPCFITDIQNAFAAWQAVSDIKFVQVQDSGAAFNAPGATGDIRIAAHAFDGISGTLAHAYFPPPTGYTKSDAGDMHFDKAENWTCTNSGINIGVVALHEIGHALGLNHETTSAVAVMDPYYNSSLTSLQTDDINGITAIYGPAAITAAAPVNDDLSAALPITTVPYSYSEDTTGALADAQRQVPNGGCDGKNLQLGHKDVWYTFTSAQNQLVYLDTFGSTTSAADHEYDTYIAVWTSAVPTPTPAQLTFLACNDDDNTLFGLQSQLALSAQAGTTYYIEVAQNAGIQGQPTAPATGGALEFHVTSFQDVPGNNWAWRYIEGLYKAGITSGCNTSPRQYCPTTAVTRDQMAIFLLRAKYGSGYVPPKATGIFSDVSTSYWAADWIEKLYADGITIGCGTSPLRYCPTAEVTRDQMAVFLLRVKYGSAYNPPAATGVFTDVPTNYWDAAWIEKLSSDGITGGCSVTPKMYCPTTIVTRDQMAIFIDRTAGFPPLP